MGWFCTRRGGHDGPCAAHPSDFGLPDCYTCGAPFCSCPLPALPDGRMPLRNDGLTTGTRFACGCYVDPYVERRCAEHRSLPFPG